MAKNTKKKRQQRQQEEYKEGERYPLTVIDVASLLDMSGSSFTGTLIGRPDYSRGRRFIKKPGNWEFWNTTGHKVTASIDADRPHVIIAVSDEPDPDRPDPLKS